MQNKVWMNESIIDESEATIPLTSDASLRGISVFEGILAYRNSREKHYSVISLSEHIKRLKKSVFLMKLDYTDLENEIYRGIESLLSLNIPTDIYLRPTIYLASGSYGKAENSRMFILARGHESHSESPIQCMTSSYHHIPPDAYPYQAKIGAVYAFYRLARIEALESGYDETILLTHSSHVTETPGASIFSIKGSTAYTPPVSIGILPSITRLNAIRILKEDLKLKVIEKKLTYQSLISSDEVFLTGTIDEIKAVKRIDDYNIGVGKFPTTSTLATYYRHQCQDGVPHFPQGTVIFKDGKVIS